MAADKPKIITESKFLNLSDRDGYERAECPRCHGAGRVDSKDCYRCARRGVVYILSDAAPVPPKVLRNPAIFMQVDKGPARRPADLFEPDPATVDEHTKVSCKVCGRRGYYSTSPRSWVAACEAGHPFQCDHCPRAFATASQLAAHRRQAFRSKQGDSFEGYAERVVEKEYANAVDVANKERASGDPARIERADARMRSWDALMARVRGEDK